MSTPPLIPAKPNGTRMPALAGVVMIAIQASIPPITTRLPQASAVDTRTISSGVGSSDDTEPTT